jgi:hypothetical protein
MAKTFAKSDQKPGAWIVSPKDRGRKSIKSGKVFLNDGDEFEIELFNPLTVSVLSDIKLNGQSISKTGLVIKPGQRVYLDCFVDDKKKFVFKTYEVEETVEVSDAIKNNGLLEVYFYKEEVVTINNWQNKFHKVIIERYPVYYPYYPYPYQPYIWYGNTGGTTGGIIYNNTTGRTTTNGSVSLGITTTTNAYYSGNPSTYTTGVDLSNLNGGGSLNLTNCSNSIETGRVEKGGKSKQKFEEVDMNFENYYISSTIIQLLPESRKPATASDISKKYKNDSTKSKVEGSTGNWPHQYQENADSVIELIKKLGDLHSAGILTEEEFSSKKSELLSKI